MIHVQHDNSNSKKTKSNYILCDFQSNRPQNESQIGPKNKNKKRINKQNYVLI